MNIAEVFWGLCLYRPRARWVLVIAAAVVLLSGGLLNAQIIKVNFQPPTAPVPIGYLADTGEQFGDRGNGYYYGWNIPTYETKEGNLYSDPLRNTCNQLQRPSNPNATWEIALENGVYDVHIVCGDPMTNTQLNTINVEGTILPDTTATNFDEYDVKVTVSDGRLTIKPATGAINAKICYVDIVREGYTNAPPWVDAGPDQMIIWPGERTVQLAGLVVDDDPDQLGQLTVRWSKAGGPGNVTFEPADNLCETAARFDAPGVYELKLEAWDELMQSGRDMLRVTVREAALVGDVDGDRDVDLKDMAILAQRWLRGGNNTADVDGSGQVDFNDFSLLVKNLGSKLSSVRINEFMASNSYTPLVSPLNIFTRFDNVNPENPDQHPDWIELYNGADEPVNLEGWCLTDDKDLPNKWSFPAGTTIPANGYLIVFASRKEQTQYPDNYPFVDYYGALHTNFELAAGGEYLALIDPEGRVAHAYDEYPPQRPLVSYGVGNDGEEGYLMEPTPGTRVNNRWTGAANSERYAGAVGDTHFSHNRGHYEQPFDVVITCDTPGAIIRYTTDGSRPTASSGTVYTKPVRVSSTTMLRAAAFKTGWLESNVDTQTYIFLNDVIQQGTDSDTGMPVPPPGCPELWPSPTVVGDYQVDPDVVGQNGTDAFGGLYASTIKDDLKSIPTLSLVMPRDDWFGPTGIYVNKNQDGTERWCSAELIDPSGGDAFQIDCAVRMQGGVSGGGTSLDRWKSYKLSMRLVFRGGYGAGHLEFPLYGSEGTDRFNTVVLEAQLNNVWHHSSVDQQIRGQYTHDQFPSNVQNALGGYGAHGRPVHLYLSGLYWGLYWIHERPDEHFAESYLGGDAYDYDVLKHNAGGVINGSNANYYQMFNAGGSTVRTISEYLDVPNFIDYMITNFYVGNNDWGPKNWYATRNRRDPLGRWRYHSWDAEHCLESLNTDVTGQNDSYAPTGLHQKLAAGDPEYRLMFADRVHKHFFNDGPLTPENAQALYQSMLDQIDRAVVGESARWGDNRRAVPYTRDVEWVAHRDWLLGSYFPYRSDIVLNQLRNRGLYPQTVAPSFSQHGGHVPSGFALTMSAPAGTIYYTLDGTDPRMPDVLPETRITLIPENAPKRVLVPTQDIGTSWRGGSEPYNDSAWNHGTPVIPGRTGGVGFETGSTLLPYISYDLRTRMHNINATCYIRIPFQVNASQLANLNFFVLRMRYDDGFVAFLNGQEIARANMTNPLTWQARASASHSGVQFQDFDVYDHLDKLRAGENILAIHGLNRRDYDGDMLISLELIAGHHKTTGEVSPTAFMYTGPITLPPGATVKARALDANGWSALNEAAFAVGSVKENLRITELMYHPEDAPPDAGYTDEDCEYVELKNIGAEAIDLANVRFTDGIDLIFGPVNVEPGQSVVVVKNEAAFRSRYPAFDGVIAGVYTGSLNNNGERIELLDAVGAVIHDFEYRDDWFDVTDGGGFSLTIRDPAAADLTLWGQREGWRPSAAPGGSPGADDSGLLPPLGTVVINELLAHSHDLEPDWIELHNTSDAPVNIGGWFLSDSSSNLQKFEIPAGTVIPAKGYIVFYEHLHFGNAQAPGCHTPFALSENGETVYLHSGENGVLTGYNDQESFGASQTGVSLGRYLKSTGTYNFVAMSEPTPGRANAYPKVGPIVISEIMYNPLGNGDAEYVELLNISTEDVTLYDSLTNEPWRFTDDGGIELFMPVAPVVTLPPGGRLLLVKNLVAFQSEFGPPVVQAIQWTEGSLNNAGEQIQLSMPGDVDELMQRQYIRVDRVVYSDGSHPVGADPWSTEPDGGGKALVRKLNTEYGNDPVNWQAAPPTPGY